MASNEKALSSLDRLRDAGVLTGIAVDVGSANIEYCPSQGISTRG